MSETVDFNVVMNDDSEYSVTLDVDEDELDALWECEEDSESITDKEDLEDLCERIYDELPDVDRDEVAFIEADSLPERLYKSEDYEGYPFAMEIVNGYVIRFDEKLQQEAMRKLLKKLGLGKDKLAVYLRKQYNDELRPGEEIPALEHYDYDFLNFITGFDPDTGCFTPFSIEWFDSDRGWEIADYLKDLGYQIEEDVNRGAHGHDTTGYYFCKG